jgi:hypothetical protein
VEPSHVTISFTSDNHGHVPYRFVLQAAIANAFGNKSLEASTYDAYKTVKKKEMECNAQILKDLAKKTKAAERKDQLTKSASAYANPLMQYLYMRLAFSTWER